MGGRATHSAARHASSLLEHVVQEVRQADAALGQLLFHNGQREVVVVHAQVEAVRDVSACSGVAMEPSQHAPAGLENERQTVKAGQRHHHAPVWSL